MIVHFHQLFNDMKIFRKLREYLQSEKMRQWRCDKYNRAVRNYLDQYGENCVTCDHHIDVDDNLYHSHIECDISQQTIKKPAKTKCDKYKFMGWFTPDE